MKFSFVIIAKNQKDTICTMLDSIVNQTYSNLEAIYVDDGSTDGSADLVERTFAADPRVKVVRHEESRGCVVSRVEGIDAATGDWVLNGDGDDVYSLRTCEILYQAISSAKEPIDLLGYGADVHYVRAVDANVKKGLEGLLHEPVLGYHNGRELLDKVFVAREKSHVVWNKCYSIDLARYVADKVVREKMVVSDDVYLNFIALSKVERYVGISDRLYVYTYGVGVTTSVTLSYQGYMNHMTAAKVYKNLYAYMKSVGLYEAYGKSIEKMEQDVIVSALRQFIRLAPEDRIRGEQAFFEAFDVDKIIGALKYHYPMREQSVAKQLHLQKVYPFNEKEVKTVGLLLSINDNNPSVYGVIRLAKAMLAAGYRVVVITEESCSQAIEIEAQGLHYVSLNDKNYTRQGENGDRCNCLAECIRRYDIEAVICYQWKSSELLWDLITIKSAGAAAIVYCAELFFASMLEGQNMHEKAAEVYRNADALAVLTDADRMYWSSVNPNVFKVAIPSAHNPTELPQAHLNSHTIIWCGENAPNQNPNDAIYILNIVKNFVSDVKLCLVDGGNQWLRAQMQEQVNLHGLEGFVEFKDQVDEFGTCILESSVYIHLGDYESYPESIVRALAYGVPVVAYEIPYIDIVARSEAIECEAWRDFQSAADVVVRLLLDSEERKARGQKARQEALELYQTDSAQTWKNVFIREFGDCLTELSDETKSEWIQTQNVMYKLMTERIRSAHQLLRTSAGERKLSDLYEHFPKWKRWLIYLLIDHETLKSIIRYKNENHPTRMKLIQGVWNGLKKLKSALRK